MASLTLLAFVAMNATVAVKAQQSSATTPMTGAANPPKLAAIVPAVLVQPVQPAQPVYYAPAPPTGDPYGFTAWLNGVRASYGLAPVGYDPSLSGWAAQNNSHQASRGIGHFVMGPARRQNSAMGDYASIGAMWMGSAAHRAALLDPTIRFIGIAGFGAYWTFNAN